MTDFILRGRTFKANERVPEWIKIKLTKAMYQAQALPDLKPGQLPSKKQQLDALAAGAAVFDLVRALIAEDDFERFDEFMIEAYIDQEELNQAIMAWGIAAAQRPFEPSSPSPNSSSEIVPISTGVSSWPDTVRPETEPPSRHGRFLEY